MKTIGFLAAAVLLMFGGRLHAQTTLEGHISYDSANQTHSIDYHLFEVLTQEAITFDVLSTGVLGGGVNNARSTFDSHLLLFELCANNCLGNLLIANSIGPTGNDGSLISGFDSYFETELNTGFYILAVSQTEFTEEEARANNNKAATANPTQGDYIVTLAGGNVTLREGAINFDCDSDYVVPEPTACLAWGVMSIVGVAIVRWRQV